MEEKQINQNSKREANFVNEIINNLQAIYYDFNVLDDFGETALKKAIDAENKVVLRELARRDLANPFARGENAQSAFDAARESNNNELMELLNT